MFSDYDYIKREINAGALQTSQITGNINHNFK